MKPASKIASQCHNLTIVSFLVAPPLRKPVSVSASCCCMQHELLFSQHKYYVHDLYTTLSLRDILKVKKISVLITLPVMSTSVSNLDCFILIRVPSWSNSQYPFFVHNFFIHKKSFLDICQISISYKHLELTFFGL